MITNKKTVLYLITQSEMGGAQHYIFNLAKNYKYEFNIIVAFGEPGEAGGLARKCRWAGIEFRAVPHLVRAISPINDLRAFFEIIKLIKSVKPDIIHLNSSKVSILGSIAIRIIYGYSSNHLRPIRVIYTVHGLVINEPLPLWQKLFYKYAEKLAARWKDKLICVSEYDRRTAIQNKIAPKEKLLTIHNGLEQINFISKTQSRQIATLNLKLRNPTYVIGSVGNLYKTKGYKYLIRAVQILNFQRPQTVTAVIIGDGPERRNLEKLSKKLDLENFIVFAGHIANALELIKAFDIYVCSSEKEGLSYSVIAAMQAGLPIVATNVGGNPELIGDYREGLLAGPGSPEKLAEKITEMISSSKKFYYGENAKQKALTDFSLEKMVGETKLHYFNNQ